MALNRELDAALCRDFPNAFRDRHAKYTESNMAFGFECGPGWEPLVRRAAESLENFIRSLPQHLQPEVRVAQVKEKYGGLRFYVTDEAWDENGDPLPVGLPQDVQGVIRAAESNFRSRPAKSAEPGASFANEIGGTVRAARFIR